MSREQPKSGCADVHFGASYAVGDAAEVALEDYARALTRARAAEAIRSDDDAGVSGVHLCGLPGPQPSTAAADIEAFARDLRDQRGDGLGWG